MDEAVEPVAYPAPNRAARRNPTLLFRFELTVGDVKLRCSTTPGDLRRARHTLAAEGLPSLDELIKSDGGGAEAMEYIYVMAWLAARHDDEWATIDLETFLDDLTEVVILKDEGDDRLRPTLAGPSNA